MKSCLLFLPFPQTYGSTNDPNAFNQLFQGESPQIMELSRATKLKGASISSFRPYIRALSTKRGSQIQATWTDPFNPNDPIHSRAIESEIAATIWNYISALHNKILLTDSSNADSLREIKKHLEEINACNSAFEEILGIIQHPVFNPNLSSFMKSYNNYISSYWQLSCIITVKEELAPKLATRCLEDIKACENICSNLRPTAYNYFFPVLQSIRAYVESYALYRLSLPEISRSQYGLAISYLRKGIDNLKSRKTTNLPYASSIEYAQQFLLNAITDQYNRINHENQNYYRQIVPDTPPLPPPCAKPVVGVSNPLLCPTNEINAPHNISVSTPNISTTSQIPNSGPNYATYGAGPVPYPAPSSPPSISYPSIQPVQIPQNPVNQPKLSSPPHPTQSPKKSSSEPLNIKEWEIVCALKKELLPRIQRAVANKNPTISSTAQSLMLQYQQASQIDPSIQESIRNCQANPSISPDTVNPYIKQADIFYTQLEERLNILERTGR